MKLIGYLVGACLVLAVLFGPIIGLYFVSQSTLEALSFQGTEIARVEKCVSKRQSGASARYVRSPKVTLANGTNVVGSVDEIKYFWPCDDLVGKEVEVLYDLENPKKAKINTFLEMWFLPLVLSLVCLAWYPAVIKGYAKKLKKK